MEAGPARAIKAVKALTAAAAGRAGQGRAAARGEGQPSERALLALLPKLREF